jgi:hypothetical protein
MFLTRAEPRSVKPPPPPKLGRDKSPRSLASGQPRNCTTNLMTKINASSVFASSFVNADRGSF